MGPAHQVAHRVQPAVDAPRGAGLDQHVAEGGGLDRPGDDRQPGPVGGRAGRAACSGSAADDVDLDGSPARSCGTPLRNASAYARREALDDAADESEASSPGAASPCSANQAAIRPGMSPGGTKRGSSARRRPATGAGDVGGSREQTGRGPCGLPRPQRLAEQPEAHHVGAGSGCVPSTPPSLVKLATRAASVSTGVVELEADQAPGAERDVRRVRAASGHADDGRGGVVRADGHDGKARRADGLARRPAAGCRCVVPGSTRSAKSPRGRPSAGDQVVVPVAGGARRAARSSRRWCARSPLDAGEPVGRAGRGPAARCRRPERPSTSSAASW